MSEEMILVTRFSVVVSCLNGELPLKGVEQERGGGCDGAKWLIGETDLERGGELVGRGGGVDDNEPDGVLLIMFVVEWIIVVVIGSTVGGNGGGGAYWGGGGNFVALLDAAFGRVKYFVTFTYSGSSTWSFTTFSTLRIESSFSKLVVVVFPGLLLLVSNKLFIWLTSPILEFGLDSSFKTFSFLLVVVQLTGELDEFVEVEVLAIIFRSFRCWWFSTSSSSSFCGLAVYEGDFEEEAVDEMDEDVCEWETDDEVVDEESCERLLVWWSSVWLFDLLGDRLRRWWLWVDDELACCSIVFLTSRSVTCFCCCCGCWGSIWGCWDWRW